MRSELKRLAILTIAYTAFSFAYSFIAFISPQPTFHFHEYSLSSFTQEVGGHFAFGLVAALPLLDLDFILLTAIFTIAIDSDHLLATLGFGVNSRPDHSILFIFVAAFLLFHVAKRLKAKNNSLVKVAFLAPVAILSHIAYDIFAAFRLFSGTNAALPLLIPFSFESVQFQEPAWIGFEIGAFLTAAIAHFAAAGYAKSNSIAVAY